MELSEINSPYNSFSREFKTTYEIDNKIFNIVLSNKKIDKLLIKIFHINSFPLNNYENEFSKDDLDGITSYFKMFNTVSDLFPDLIEKLEKKEFKLIVHDDLIQLYFYINIRNVPDLSLPIKKLETSLPSTVDSLCEIINKILKDNDNMKKEIEELKNDVLILKKEKEERDKIENEKKEIINNNFSDSSIIENYEDKCMISNWIKPNTKIKLELLFKASRDGDSIFTFNQKVAGKSPTLVIVKNTVGFIFGGFTSMEWNMNENYQNDYSAFIFSINNKRKYEIKGEAAGNAIYKNNSLFAFGSGHDFAIYDQCTTRNDNYANCGSTYRNNSFNELTGDYNFRVQECEVYQVIYL